MSGKVLLSRPKDRSLEAYKAWIMEFLRFLTGREDGTMTEEQWRQGWQEFWAKADENAKKKAEDDQHSGGTQGNTQI